MACTYTFNGTTYTEQEFKDYIASNKDQLLATYGNLPINASAPNIPDTFEQQYYSDPLISKIGTLEEYRIFMNTASDRSLTAFASIVDEPVLPSGETKYEYVQYILARRENTNVVEDLTAKESNELVEQLAEYESIKDGVDFVFESNSELANIGTPQEYSNYLDTIFPDSQVKDIVYRGIAENGVKRSEGIYFTKSKQDAAAYGNIITTVINNTNPVASDVVNTKIKSNITKENIDTLVEEGYDSIHMFDSSGNNLNEYVVFNTNQIHTLGSKDDVTGFSAYVANLEKSPDISSVLTGDHKQLYKDIIDNIDMNFDLQEAIYESTTLNSVEKEIIESAVTYIRESFAAYANRIRREPLNLKFQQLVDLYESMDAAELPDKLLTIQEMAQVIEILSMDYAINKEALLGVNGRNGILTRLNGFKLFDMQEIIDNEQSRQNFADFMKRASIVLKGFDRIEIFLTSMAETNVDELKELNKVIKLHQSLMGEVVNAKAVYKRLMDSYFEARSMGVTTNPNVVQGMMNIFTAQDDETLTQMMLDSIADTHNVFVATTIKNYIRHMGNAKEDINQELTEFRGVLMTHFNLTDPKDLENITTSAFDKYLERDADGEYTGRIKQKYDWDAFYAAKSAMYEKANQFPKHSDPYRAVLANWYAKHEIKLGLSAAQVNDIVAERKSTLTEKAFQEWHNKNFSKYTVNGKEKLGFRVQGEFARPSDDYLSADYNTVKDDPLYQYLYKTLKKYANYDSVSNIIMDGYLPVLHKDHGTSKPIRSMEDLSEWFNSHRAKRIDEFTGENNEVIRLLHFPMADKLSKNPTIPISERYKDEALIDHEIRVLRETKDAGLGDFNSLEEIKDHNAVIRAENNKLHGQRFNKNVKGVIERFIEEATTYRYKKAIESELLLALTQIRDTKMIVRNDKGFQSKNSAASKKLKAVILDTQTPGESHLAKHFDGWLEAIFYDGFDIDEKAWTAIGKIFLKYVSAKSMWLNVTSGFNNVIYGNLQVEVERAAKYFVDSEDLKEADKLYWGNITSLFADIGSSSASNEVSGFLKFMDIVESQTEKEVGAKLLYKKLISTDTMYALQEGGEHQMQNRMLLAMAHGHRIIGGKIYSFADYKGDNRADILRSILTPAEFELYTQYVAARLEKEKYLDGKKNYVESFLMKVMGVEHMKLYAAAKKKTDQELRKEFEAEGNIRVIDAFELVNGLTGIKKTSDGTPLLSGAEIAQFRNKVVHVNHKLHGIYNKFDAGLIQRKMLGKMALQFRKWIRPGFTKRFGSRFFKSFWNETRNEWDDGSFATTIKMMFAPFSENSAYSKEDGLVLNKFMSNLTRDYMNYIRNFKLYWSVLSDHDKAQVRRTMMDMIYLMGTVVLGMMMGKLGDDDDEKEKGFGSTYAYDFMMFQIDRMYSEFIFYTPAGLINEGQKIMRSPMATYSTMTDMGIFFKHLSQYFFIDDAARHYKGGLYHKELKLKISAIKLTPVVNQYQRLARLRKNNTYYNLFGHAR